MNVTFLLFYQVINYSQMLVIFLLWINTIQSKALQLANGLFLSKTRQSTKNRKLIFDFFTLLIISALTFVLVNWTDFALHFQCLYVSNCNRRKASFYIPKISFITNDIEESIVTEYYVKSRNAWCCQLLPTWVHCSI